MTLLKKMSDGMPRAEHRPVLNSTAGEVPFQHGRSNTRPMSELPPTVAFGKRLRVTPRWALCAGAEIKVELLGARWLVDEFVE